MNALDILAKGCALLGPKGKSTGGGGGVETILVIRRNRMGDMICTLPLLKALRRGFPRAVLTVACEKAGAPIAEASGVVDKVLLLESGFNRWLSVVTQAVRLQGYDLVIAAKGGFDPRLALLTRLTNGTRRIGFGRRTESVADYYTDAVALPPPFTEHQIETILRLLEPLGLDTGEIDLSLELPEEATAFAAQMNPASFLVLLNISSTQRMKWDLDDFAELGRRLMTEDRATVAIIFAPRDLSRAVELRNRIEALGGGAGPKPIIAPLPSTLFLAAVLQKAAFVFTPEGGVGHLAAAVGTPALIFWSEGPFEKWKARGRKQHFFRADLSEKKISPDEVYEVIARDFLPAAAERGAA